MTRIRGEGIESGGRAVDGTIGASPGPSLLERRYRTWLRLLPPEYRDRWEEEMVETFLATADAEDPDFADYGRPPTAEVASVLALAVRLRLGGMPTQRSQEWGAAARYVALAGMLVNAALSVWGLLSLAVFVVTSGGGVRPDPADLSRLTFTSQESEWLVTELWTRLFDQALGVLWIGAYFALVLGRHRLARRLGTAALLPGVGMLGLGVLADVFGLPFNPTTPTSVLVTVLLAVPLAASLAFGPVLPPDRRRVWLRAGVAGLLLSPAFELVTVGLVLLGRDSVLLNVLDWVGLSTVVLVGASVVASGRRVADRRGWELALLVLAGLLFVARLCISVAYLPPTADSRDAAALVVHAVELLALAGVGAGQIVALRRSAPAVQPVRQP